MKESTAVFSSLTCTKGPAITWFGRVGAVWIDKNIVSEREVGEICLGMKFFAKFEVLVSSSGLSLSSTFEEFPVFLPEP